MTGKYRFLQWLMRKIMYSKYDFRFSYTNFDPDRTDPYFIIGNHVSLLDGQYTFLPLALYSFPVINIFEYTSRLMDFVLTKIIQTIPKRKGQSDIQTIRMMMDAMKKGNGVLLYPEGNSSYFGKESELAISTAKFLKKSKFDIIFCHVDGGYLTAPRWGDEKIRGGRFEVHYYTLFKAEELPLLTVEQVHAKIVEAMKFNDFEWNRTAKAKYITKRRAEGLQRFIYWCPVCDSVQTIKAQGNEVHCDHCGKIATFDEYSFLQGERMPFDNLVPWGEQQLKKIPEVVKRPIETTGIVHLTNLTSHRRKKLGEYHIKLENHQLLFQRKKRSFALHLAEVKGLVLTKKEGLSFDYLDRVYYIFVKDPMLFLNAIDYLNGGNA
jgi:hypothetical protein